MIIRMLVLYLALLSCFLLNSKDIKKYYYIKDKKVAEVSYKRINFYFSDHRGEIYKSTDIDGKIYSNVSSSNFNLRYLSARYLDVNTNLFISADSLVPDHYLFSQSLNRYNYCYNNNIRFIDPSGHCPWRVFKNFCKCCSCCNTVEVLDPGQTGPVAGAGQIQQLQNLLNQQAAGQVVNAGQIQQLQNLPNQQAAGLAAGQQAQSPVNLQFANLVAGQVVNTYQTQQSQIPGQANQFNVQLVDPESQNGVSPTSLTRKYAFISQPGQDLKSKILANSTPSSPTLLISPPTPSNFRPEYLQALNVVYPNNTFGVASIPTLLTPFNLHNVNPQTLDVASSSNQYNSGVGQTSNSRVNTNNEIASSLNNYFDSILTQLFSGTTGHQIPAGHQDAGSSMVKEMLIAFKGRLSNIEYDLGNNEDDVLDRGMRVFNGVNEVVMTVILAYSQPNEGVVVPDTFSVPQIFLNISEGGDLSQRSDSPRNFRKASVGEYTYSNQDKLFFIRDPFSDNPVTLTDAHMAHLVEIMIKHNELKIVDSLFADDNSTIENSFAKFVKYNNPNLLERVITITNIKSKSQLVDFPSLVLINGEENIKTFEEVAEANRGNLSLLQIVATIRSLTGEYYKGVKSDSSLNDGFSWPSGLKSSSVADSYANFPKSLFDGIQSRFEEILKVLQENTDYIKQEARLTLTRFKGPEFCLNGIYKQLVLYRQMQAGINAQILKRTKPGDGVVTFGPGYISLKRNPKELGRDLKTVDLLYNEQDGNYKIDIDKLNNEVKDAKLLIICNPNNPTMKSFKEEDMEIIAKAMKENTNLFILVDEIHLGITSDNPLSFRQYFSQHHKDLLKRTVVVTSFSKQGPFAAMSPPSIVILPDGEKSDSPGDLSLEQAVFVNEYLTKNDFKIWKKAYNEQLKVSQDAMIIGLENMFGPGSVTRPDDGFLIWTNIYKKIEASLSETEKGNKSPEELKKMLEGLSEEFIKYINENSGGYKISAGSNFGSLGSLGFARFNCAKSVDSIKTEMEYLKKMYEEWFQSKFNRLPRLPS